jgi:flagellar export protein FliJ
MLREQKEQAAQQRHAKALAACRTAGEQLEMANLRLAEAREWFSMVLADKSAAAKVMNVRTWCAALEINQREYTKALNDARRNAEQTLREMTAATRDREGLDRYREKSRRAYEYELRREEQKISDEMATQPGRMGGLLEFAGQENFVHA